MERLAQADFEYSFKETPKPNQRWKPGQVYRCTYETSPYREQYDSSKNFNFVVYADPKYQNKKRYKRFLVLGDYVKYPDLGKCWAQDYDHKHILKVAKYVGTVEEVYGCSLEELITLNQFVEKDDAVTINKDR